MFGFAYNITRNQDLRFCSRIRDVFSFQQQQHSIAFMLLDLGGHWDVSFLPEVISSSNLIGPVKGYLRLLSNFY